MKNRNLNIILSLLIVSTFALGACGKKPSSQKEPQVTDEATSEKTAPAAGVGSIKGVVKFTGTAPDLPDLNRQSDPVCAKTKMKAQFVVVNPNQTLANVAVIVDGPKGGNPEKVVIDQKECMYTPRVQTALSGQEVEITNSDATLHNVHTYAGSKTLFNRAQPKNSPAIKKNMSIEGDVNVVKFKCDVHPWMTGWLVLGENNLGAVSDTSGEFVIKNVPVGTHTIKAFQEKYGWKTVQVTVEADKEAAAEFSYDGSETAAYKFREINLSMAHPNHH